MRGDCNLLKDAHFIFVVNLVDRKVLFPVNAFYHLPSHLFESDEVLIPVLYLC